MSHDQNSFTGIPSFLHASFSIVQSRMRKLLKRMVASPMRRSHYLLAQVLARLLFLLPEVAVPLLFGRYVIGMPLRGSLVAVAVVSLVGALSCGGLGLLIASRTKTFEAISGLVNLILLPMWIGSGVFFSEEIFGKPAPVTHKTVFGVISWLIFAALLVGRHVYGWRGRVAVRWTLAGFLALVLAYIGSRFVLEVVLGRA